MKSKFNCIFVAIFLLLIAQPLFAYPSYISLFTNPSPQDKEDLETAKNLKVTMRVDSENDDEWDKVNVWAYNNEGYLDYEKKDTDYDGHFEEVANHKYDSSGYLDKIEVSRDTKDDILVDYTFSEEQVVRWQGPIDGGEEEGTEHIYTLNSEGNIIEEDIQYEDIQDRIYYFTFDYTVNEYRPVEQQKDIGKDGTTDSFIYYTYDTIGGKKVKVKQERAGANNMINSVTKYFYNDSGYRIRTEIDWSYDGNTFEPDEIEYITRNDDGLKLKEETDDDNNGTIDYVKSYSYEETSSSDDESDSSDSDSDDGGGGSGGCFINSLLH